MYLWAVSYRRWDYFTLLCHLECFNSRVEQKTVVTIPSRRMVLRQFSAQSSNCTVYAHKKSDLSLIQSSWNYSQLFSVCLWLHYSYPAPFESQSNSMRTDICISEGFLFSSKLTMEWFSFFVAKCSRYSMI